MASSAPSSTPVGSLPGLMRAQGLSEVIERDRIATLTGSISLYAARVG
jgi:hypothetical protein